MDLLFTALEKYEMTFEELVSPHQLVHILQLTWIESSSRIGKVMQHIDNSHIPILQDDKYHFKTRAKNLTEKWKGIWGDNPAHSGEEAPLPSPVAQRRQASTPVRGLGRIQQQNAVVSAGASPLSSIAPSIVHVPIPQISTIASSVPLHNGGSAVLPTVPTECSASTPSDSTERQTSTPELRSLPLSRLTSASRTNSPVLTTSRKLIIQALIIHIWNNCVQI